MLRRPRGSSNRVHAGPARGRGPGSPAAGDEQSAGRHTWGRGRSLKEPGGGTGREGKGREERCSQKPGVCPVQLPGWGLRGGGSEDQAGEKYRPVPESRGCSVLEQLTSRWSPREKHNNYSQERNKNKLLTIKIYTKLPAKLKSVAPRKKKIYQTSLEDIKDNRN